MEILVLLSGGVPFGDGVKYRGNGGYAGDGITCVECIFMHV